MKKFTAILWIICLTSCGSQKSTTAKFPQLQKDKAKSENSAAQDQTQNEID